MIIFYSEAQGRPNIPAVSPVNESVENVLSIFRNLDQRRGFLGIVLKEPFVLQLLAGSKGVRIELLNSSIPAVDVVNHAKPDDAERLIRAAADGQDVLQIARQTISGWEHLKLG
jgi:hypothetical protein